jgi:hypothetical protein
MPQPFRLITLTTAFFLSFCYYSSYAQPITGVWKGKIGRQRAEVKIIQKGDSLTGTSYYYDGASNYRRYSIKGYFDQSNNSVVWWDDALLEDKTGRLSLSAPGASPMLSSADFNCPGGGEMLLDGKTNPQKKASDEAPVHLKKSEGYPQFKDAWDYVIDNFTLGTNDPDIIDSIGNLAVRPAPKKEEKRVPEAPPVAKTKKPGMVTIPPIPAPVAKQEPVPTKPIPIEEKFTVRKKVFTTEIPLEGDSIELRFYDNAEIDGDSISLFLNDQLLFQHIRLAASAYTIKLPVSALNDNNELVMVAENLGSIPPNTSYMVAVMGDKRYEARLASTENSSALIKLTKAAAVKSAPQ